MHDLLIRGATIIDAGIKFPGGLEAGRLITEICMGGLGRVSLHSNPSFAHWPWQLEWKTLWDNIIGYNPAIPHSG